MVRLAHAMPGQSREKDGDSPGICSPAAFGAFVQVLWQHEVERDGVEIIAEAEVDGNGRKRLVA